MSVDALLRGLVDEMGAVAAPLLRKAYDLGYREALASAGKAPEAAPAVPSEESSARDDGGAPRTAVVFADDDDLEPEASDVPGATSQPQRTVDWGDGDDEVEPDEDEGQGDGKAASAPRPIHAKSSVGTLRNRIVRTFGLERFDIDIVICRRGDPSRRQLKTNVRLSKYRVEQA